MVSRPKVLFAGHTSLDIIPDLSTLTTGYARFRPGSLIEAKGVRFATGGAVLNTGLSLHRLGAPVRLLIKLGSDYYGTILKDLIYENVCAAEGMEPQRAHLIYTEDAAAQTSFTFVLNPPKADRMFIGCLGVNETFSVDDIRYDHLEGIEMMHLGYPTLLQKLYVDGGRHFANFLRDVQARGIMTSLDVAMPDLQGKSGQVDWQSFLATVLPHVDLFMPSIEEMMLMLNGPRFHEIHSHGGDFIESLTGDDLTALADTLIQMGVQIVGLKLGNYGLYLRTSSKRKKHFYIASWQQPLHSQVWNNRELYAPCFSVEVAGTTGAGDATIAGFLDALLYELSPEMCMVHAVAVGAFSVEGADSIGGIASSEAVQDRVLGDWHQSPAGPWARHWEKHGRIYLGPRDGSSGA
ncbi:carbohydrate kinase family protein [Alicyclobacillus curvatus]|nr:carbohydrate kinase family protein [Alicyclobacillus curvatus]